MIHWLTRKLVFPPYHFADKDGLLAVGGDLSVERLMLAYSTGIFPWYNPEDPILWWSPDPRFVLLPSELKVSRTMRQVLDRNIFQITTNQAFEQVMRGCQAAKREGQNGTWISEEIVESYCKLHELGWAHSIEAWQEGELVGGLYGIKIGRCFSGESMFAKKSNASKAAFITYVRQIEKEGIELVDCQTRTPHLESLGGKFMRRKEFLGYLT